MVPVTRIFFLASLVAAGGDFIPTGGSRLRRRFTSRMCPSDLPVRGFREIHQVRLCNSVKCRVDKRFCPSIVHSSLYLETQADAWKESNLIRTTFSGTALEQGRKIDVETILTSTAAAKQNISFWHD